MKIKCAKQYALFVLISWLIVKWYKPFTMSASNLNLNECLFLPLDHNWFLYSFSSIIGTCHVVYSNVIALNSAWFPHHLILRDWGLGLVKKLWSPYSFLFLWRYDEANKDYDAILQDDPTNTVRLRSRERKGKIPLLSILLCCTLWSQFFGRL